MSGTSLQTSRLEVNRLLIQTPMPQLFIAPNMAWRVLSKGGGNHRRLHSKELYDHQCSK